MNTSRAIICTMTISLGLLACDPQDDVGQDWSGADIEEGFDSAFDTAGEELDDQDDADGLENNWDTGMDAEDLEAFSGEFSRDAELCDLYTGAYNVAFMGRRLHDHEGMKVWGVAVQPDPSPHTATPTVLLKSRIKNGKFSMECGSSLESNGYYPSAAVIIDADNSGDCTEDDLMVVEQWYGWANDLRLMYRSTDFFTVGTATTWGGQSICDYYVPEAME